MIFSGTDISLNLMATRKLSVKNLLILTLLAFTVLVFFQNCNPVKSEVATSPTVSQGSRKLGIHITQAQGESFLSTFSLIQADLFNHTNLHQIWGPGTFALASLPVAPLTTDSAGTVFDFATLDIANAFYPTTNMPVMLTIGTIDTNNKLVPSTFNSTAFDDSGLRAAFKTMLTNMMPHLASTQLVSLQIGNEVDAYLGTNATAWAQYKVFFDDVAAHARTLRPGLLVGTTVTLSAAINPALQSYVQSLVATADIVSVTYYPINADFSVKTAATVANEIASLVAAFGTKPIYFQEVGFPSAGSEELQRQFVADFFANWDIFANQIPVVSWLNYTEWAPATVDGFGTQYGMCPGTNCVPFKNFLQTLGLRNYSPGTAKPALVEMRNQMTSRGWMY